MIISFLFRFSSSSLVTKLRNLRVLGPGTGMPQDDQLGLTRWSRHVYRSGGDRDDRGWTLLHIGARKGDLKEYDLVTFPLSKKREKHSYCFSFSSRIELVMNN
ncbi:hypothetical protein ACSBR1_029578 [Camellia fascicularis]